METPAESEAKARQPVEPLGDPVALSLAEIDIDPAVSVRFEADSEEEQRRIDELARSIAAQGQLSPVLVRQSADGRYKLIAGHRRLRAIALIQKKFSIEWRVSALVVDKDDEQAWDAAFSENYQRRNFSPIELAHNIMALKQRKNWPEEEWLDNAVRYVDLSRSTVTQHLKLLRLPMDVQDRIHEGQMGAQAAFDLMAHEEARNASRHPEDFPDASQVLKAAEQKALADERKETAARKAKGLPPKPAAKGKSGPVVKRKHILAAAREADAPGVVKARTRSDFVSFLEELMGPTCPEVMNKFLEGMTGKWAKGTMTDRTLMTRWDAITDLVEAGLHAQKATARKGRVA